jgi:hypothetical protein
VAELNNLGAKEMRKEEVNERKKRVEDVKRYEQSRTIKSEYKIEYVTENTE